MTNSKKNNDLNLKPITEMQKVHVLTSQYNDKSGFKIIRVYIHQDLPQAVKDLKMLSDHGATDREYMLHETELYQNNL